MKKRTIAEDGTKSHEFTVAEKRYLRQARGVVEEAAFWYRDTDQGVVLSALSEQLQALHDGETLVDESLAPAE